MKHIANVVSSIRIVLALSLLRIEPLSGIFYGVYVVCLLSDALDGIIARRTGTVSRLGQQLDSAADLILISVLIYRLYPLLTPPVYMFVWIAAIGCIRVCSLLLVWKKFHTFAIMHTLGNKITGACIFVVFPFSLLMIPPTIAMGMVCLVASASALEELLIHLRSNSLNPDQRSLWN